MGPGSPPSGSPSTVERGPRSGCMSARAALCPLSLLQCAGCGPDPSSLGPWSPFSHWPLHCLLHMGFRDPPPASHALHPGPCLLWAPETYRPEVTVELVVLPQVGQEAGRCPGGLLTVGAEGGGESGGDTQPESRVGWEDPWPDC